MDHVSTQGQGCAFGENTEITMHFSLPTNISYRAFANYQVTGTFYAMSKSTGADVISDSDKSNMAGLLYDQLESAGYQQAVVTMTSDKVTRVDPALVGSKPRAVLKSAALGFTGTYGGASTDVHLYFEYTGEAVGGQTFAVELPRFTQQFANGGVSHTWRDLDLLGGQRGSFEKAETRASVQAGGGLTLTFTVAMGRVLKACNFVHVGIRGTARGPFLPAVGIPGRGHNGAINVNSTNLYAAKVHDAVYNKLDPLVSEYLGAATWQPGASITTSATDIFGTATPLLNLTESVLLPPGATDSSFASALSLLAANPSLSQTVLTKPFSTGMITFANVTNDAPYGHISNSHWTLDLTPAVDLPTVSQLRLHVPEEFYLDAKKIKDQTSYVHTGADSSAASPFNETSVEPLKNGYFVILMNMGIQPQKDPGTGVYTRPSPGPWTLAAGAKKVRVPCHSAGFACVAPAYLRQHDLRIRVELIFQSGLKVGPVSLDSPLGIGGSFVMSGVYFATSDATRKGLKPVRRNTSIAALPGFPQRTGLSSWGTAISSVDLTEINFRWEPMCSAGAAGACNLPSNRAAKKALGPGDRIDVKLPGFAGNSSLLRAAFYDTSLCANPATSANLQFDVAWSGASETLSLTMRRFAACPASDPLCKAAVGVQPSGLDSSDSKVKGFECRGDAAKECVVFVPALKPTKGIAPNSPTVTITAFEPLATFLAGRETDQRPLTSGARGGGSGGVAVQETVAVGGSFQLTELTFDPPNPGVVVNMTVNVKVSVALFQSKQDAIFIKMPRFRQDTALSWKRYWARPDRLTELPQTARSTWQTELKGNALTLTHGPECCTLFWDDVETELVIKVKQNIPAGHVISIRILDSAGITTPPEGVAESDGIFTARMNATSGPVVDPVKLNWYKPAGGKPSNNRVVPANLVRVSVKINKLIIEDSPAVAAVYERFVNDDCGNGLTAFLRERGAPVLATFTEAAPLGGRAATWQPQGVGGDMSYMQEREMTQAELDTALAALPVNGGHPKMGFGYNFQGRWADIQTLVVNITNATVGERESLSVLDASERSWSVVGANGMTDRYGRCISRAPSPTVKGLFSRAQEIIEVKAEGTGCLLSKGDKIKLHFAQPTDMGDEAMQKNDPKFYCLDRLELDSLFETNNKLAKGHREAPALGEDVSLGTYYHGVWSNTTILDIVIDDVKDVPMPNDLIGNLKFNLIIQPTANIDFGIALLRSIPAQLTTVEFSIFIGTAVTNNSAPFRTFHADASTDANLVKLVADTTPIANNLIRKFNIDTETYPIVGPQISRVVLHDYGGVKGAKLCNYGNNSKFGVYFRNPTDRALFKEEGLVLTKADVDSILTIEPSPDELARFAAQGAGALPAVTVPFAKNYQGVWKTDRLLEIQNIEPLDTGLRDTPSFSVYRANDWVEMNFLVKRNIPVWIPMVKYSVTFKAFNFTEDDQRKCTRRLVEEAYARSFTGNCILPGNVIGRNCTYVE